MPVTFKNGEVVLCRWRDDEYGYPATIKNAEVDETGKTTYHVHYNAWNNRFDECISSNEIDGKLWKYTPALAKKHQRLLAEAKEREKSAKKESGKRAATSTTTRNEETEVKPKVSKKSVEEKVKQEPPKETKTTRKVDKKLGEEKVKEEKIAINVPMELRKLIIKDKKFIEDGKLVKLPADVAIDQLVDEYRDTMIDVKRTAVTGKNNGKKGAPSNKLNDKEKTAQTIVEFFNLMCKNKLLYGQERQQFEKACVKPTLKAKGRRVDKKEMPELEGLEIVPSSVYGLPHLARLFIRIGPYLLLEKYSDEAKVIIAQHLRDLLDFLQTKTESVDMNELYEEAKNELKNEKKDEKMNEKKTEMIKNKK